MKVSFCRSSFILKARLKASITVKILFFLTSGCSGFQPFLNLAA
jgi:hypothetical protein